MPAIGRSKCLQPIRKSPTTSPLWASTASTRETMTWAGSCLSEGGSQGSMACLTGTIGRSLGSLGKRAILSAGRFRRVPRSPVVNRQADRLGQQQAEDPDREAEQARRVQVGLEQGPARQAQVEQATNQPEGPSPGRAR